MNLTDILDEFRVRYFRHGEDKAVRLGWIGMHCPYCDRPEEKNYLGWHLEKHFFTCWSCGYVKAPETLSLLIGKSVGACLRLLGGLPRAPRWDDGGDNGHPRRGRYTPPHLSLLPLEFSPAHRKYVRQRGFDPEELVRLWQVSAIAIAPKIQWRLFIPVIWHNEYVSWTTRTIGDKEPRYISAAPQQETIPHKHVLYGGDFVRHAVIVHEGPLDVWATGPGAVATFGVGFTPEQVLWLSQIPQRFVCFDSEPAAQLRAQQLCDQLAGFPGQTANVLLDAKDPASATAKELEELRGLLR
jgi:hypothetical protein